MLIKLDTRNVAHQKFSYLLQKERYEYATTNIPHLTPESVPTFIDHLKYLKLRLHKHYYIYMEDYTYKGVIYLKNSNEICIFIVRKCLGQGCGEKCVEEFLKIVERDPNIKELIATVGINNIPSNNLFKRLGFDYVANLYGITL